MKRALSLAQLNAIAKPGNTWVGPQSLYLQVRIPNRRSWLFRYERQGKTRWMGLGPATGPAAVSLSDARDQALRLYLAVRDGADPVVERRAKRAEVAEQSSAPAFAWCCSEYIAAHEASWRNEKHRAQWTSTLATYAEPILGKKAVDQIAVDDVLKVLKPIWTSKPETASRLRGRIERVLGWATAKGHRSGENPAAWRGGALPHLLPALGRIQKVKPRQAVPYAEVPAVMARLAKLDSTSAQALKFAVLTAARTGEVIGARWSEFDLDAKVWTIPPERMKAGVEHRVALSDAVMAVLGKPRAGGGLLFPGAKPTKPLSSMALLQCLRGIRGDDGSTVHGFRSAFSTWAAEATEHPREIVEASLAHATGNAVELAYKRTDYLAKRVALMDDWAKHCTGPANHG